MKAFFNAGYIKDESHAENLIKMLCFDIIKTGDPKKES